MIRIHALVATAAFATSMCAFAQSSNAPIPASGNSPGTVGAMQGVEPAPGVGASTPAPKLIRKTPGAGTTQPSHGSRAIPAASTASVPGEKSGGK